MVEVDKHGYKETTLSLNLMSESPISLIRASITFYPYYPIGDKRVSRNYDQIMIVHITFNENFIYHILRSGNQVFRCHDSRKSSYENVEITTVTSDRN